MTIQPADPAARKKAILIAVVLVILLAGLLTVLQSLDGDWLADVVIHKPILLPLFGLVLMAPVLWFAVFTFRKGGQVVRSLRFPIPGEPVIRDTPVREGPAAVRTGRLLQLLSVLLLVCALGVPWLLWRLAESFGHG